MAVPVQSYGLNSALNPVEYGHIVLSINTQYNRKKETLWQMYSYVPFLPSQLHLTYFQLCYFTCHLERLYLSRGCFD